jgi:hypothetical protein
MMSAAANPYWNALADDEFDCYERRQRFIDHFAAVLTHRAGRQSRRPLGADRC